MTAARIRQEGEAVLFNIMSRLKRMRAEIHETHRHVEGMARALSSSAQALADVRRQVGQVSSGLEVQAARIAAEAGTRPEPPATWVPPGHFYSPIVDTDELERRRSRVFDRSAAPHGIDLREAEQLALLRRLKPHYQKLPFRPDRSGGLRYGYENPNFSYGDAIILACLLMELRPERFVEIGSGHSSCVIMDVNDLFLDRSMDISFVEPYPDLLRSLMTPADRERYAIVPTPVQDLDLSLIDGLRAGDVLFIDSTHVSKCGSDVNFELFTILPRLASGVHIHFHDIFYPFEYPEAWFFETNRSWNEIYVLRAFLVNNAEYEIVLFNDFLGQRHMDVMRADFPLFERNPGGSLWLRKR
ncbi:class I SAM-dependent methyltransferase [Teichococcus rhizosphaerae]|uniref:class I SAM-dependent methyltransferase n=1 Tax=Teichococcus rhizosphaerae TaxID=1335062 RepID=UPI001C3F38CB|nr:class I SAM-dependent methyltransferase [Pseudoroseomonas rhizosphaerae]